MNLRLFWDLHAPVWFRPLLWITGICLLALALLELDELLLLRGATITTPWLFVDSGEGARTILGALATAMLTVAALAFSILMLAVVQTANAYSPRVLREYLADPGNQHVLGILLGTFLYTLIILRRVEDTEEHIFLPIVSISVALALSLIAVLVFVYFINHVALSIEVNAIMLRILDESEALVQSLFPSMIGRPSLGEAAPALPDGGGMPIIAKQAGYIAALAHEQLMSVLGEADAVMRMERMVGDYVLSGTTLATVWQAQEGKHEKLDQKVRDAIKIGNERATVQDLHFALEQLTDIGLRALSSAVNDPHTVVNCLNVLATLLSELARREPVSPYRLDDAGRLRIIASGPDFASSIGVAFIQLHPDIATNPIPTLRLLEIYVELAQIVQREAERETLWQHLWRFAFFADKAILSPWDREAINQHLMTATRTLNRSAEGLLLEVEMPPGYNAHNTKGA